MNVQLKQSEIIEALKQYIVVQGINLTGKDVTITFTAGRKEAGITADLVIEEAGIPGFAEGDDEAEVIEDKAGLRVVDSSPELKAATDADVSDDTDAQAPETVVKSTSLFS